MGNKIEITYPICNAGQTPAVFTGEHSRANVYRLMQYPDPFRRGEIATLKKSVVVPPTRTENESSGYKGSYSLELSDEEVISMEKGASMIVFHGFIRYVDIFDILHDTGFGVVYIDPCSEGQTHHMAWIQKLGFNWFD